MAGAWANRVQSQCRRRGLAGWRRSAKPPFLAAGSSLERRARRRVGLSGDAGGDRGDRGDRPAARGRATVSKASRTHAACVAPLSGWKTGSRGPRRQRYATAAGSVIHTLRLGGKNSSCARQRFALNRLRLIAAGPTCFRACRLEIASPRPRSVCSCTDRSLPQHLSRRVVLPILCDRGPGDCGGDGLDDGDPPRLPRGGGSVWQPASPDRVAGQTQPTASLTRMAIRRFLFSAGPG